MSLLRSISEGLRSLFRKEQVNKELDEELSGFLEMAAEEKIKEGMSRKDALRAVRLERGTLEVTKEVVRSAGWEALVESRSIGKLSSQIGLLLLFGRLGFQGWQVARTKGYRLRVGTVRSPVLGRERNAPKLRIGFAEFDAHFRYSIGFGADVHHRAGNLFGCFRVFQRQDLSFQDRFLQQEQPSVGVDDDSGSIFYKRHPVRAFARYFEPYGKKYALATPLLG
jgi:hypothetical protein